jgi:hypothetical protein
MLVTFELALLGRYGLTDFADELQRAHRIGAPHEEVEDGLSATCSVVMMGLRFPFFSLR